MDDQSQPPSSATYREPGPPSNDNGRGDGTPLPMTFDEICIAIYKKQIERREAEVLFYQGQSARSHRGLIAVKAAVAQAVDVLRKVEGVALVDQALEILVGASPGPGDPS